jgi:large subunit ribosomal protein L19e
MKNLDKRKRLAGKVFGVGINRIIFDNSRLDEIKEAITKQDIKDLHESGAIIVNPVLGRKTKEKRRTRRGFGKIKMKINPGKEKYVTLVRKLRE